MAVQELTMHEMVTTEIAKSRFNLDDWHVTVNQRSTENLAPDIVATHSDEIVAVGAVESLATSFETRIDHWKSFGESCSRFYLFVPEGTEQKAADLVRQHEIACAGLRSYSVNGHVNVTSVHLDDVMHKEDEHRWWLSIGRLDH